MYLLMGGGLYRLSAEKPASDAGMIGFMFLWPALVLSSGLLGTIATLAIEWREFRHRCAAFLARIVHAISGDPPPKEAELLPASEHDAVASLKRRLRRIEAETREHYDAIDRLDEERSRIEQELRERGHVTYRGK